MGRNVHFKRADSQPHTAAEVSLRRAVPLAGELTALAQIHQRPGISFHNSDRRADMRRRDRAGVGKSGSARARSRSRPRRRRRLAAPADAPHQPPPRASVGTVANGGLPGAALSRRTAGPPPPSPQPGGSRPSAADFRARAAESGRLRERCCVTPADRAARCPHAAAAAAAVAPRGPRRPTLQGNSHLPLQWRVVTLERNPAARTRFLILTGGILILTPTPAELVRFFPP